MENEAVGVSCFKGIKKGKRKHNQYSLGNLSTFHKTFFFFLCNLAQLESAVRTHSKSSFQELVKIENSGIFLPFCLSVCLSLTRAKLPARVALSLWLPNELLLARFQQPTLDGSIRSLNGAWPVAMLTCTDSSRSMDVGRTESELIYGMYRVSITCY